MMGVRRSDNWEQKRRYNKKAFQIDSVRRFILANARVAKAAIGLLLAFALSVFAFGVYSLNDHSSVSSADLGGETIIVRSGSDFQAALDRSKRGDTIELEAGAKFVGNFNLPKKSGEGFITIRSNAKDNEIPAEHARIDPKKYGKILPRLSSATTEPVLSASDGAAFYRFIAVEFGGTKDGHGNIIKIGTGEEKTIADLPHHIEFDRVYIRATSPLGQRRGIAANGRYIRIINSYIEGIRRRGDESQAIAVWSTDGPVEILNNYLEGAAENVLFGGGSSFLKLTPTDCLVRDNHLNKPVEWINEDWGVKNLFEIKDGIRIRVENNLMTNNWAQGQDGTAILFSTRDTGHPVIIENITFINNIVKGSGNAISVYGSEGNGGRNLTIRNNFFVEIDGGKWKGTGLFMKSSAWTNLIIENNTIINSGSIASAYDAPVTGFVFRNNIVFEGEYGFKGDSFSGGQKTLDQYFPRANVADNIIIGGSSDLYRERNFFLSSLSKIGFIDPQRSNYSLATDSPFSKKGVGGKQIGASLDVERVGGY